MKQKLEFIIKGNRTTVPFDEILFIESIDHHLCIKTADKLYDTRSFTLSEAELMLNNESFIRTHRSYIVNISHIRSISKGSLLLRGYSHGIPISRARKKSVQERIVEK